MIFVAIEKSNETHWIYKFIECVTIINYDYWCILLIYTCSIWSKMKNNYTPLPKPLITTITSSLDSIFNLIKTMVIKLIYMFSAHFQIMPKFDNMVLSDLVLFKDGMYFIYSLTETLSNYRDYSINKKQFLVHHVN